MAQCDNCYHKKVCKMFANKFLDMPLRRVLNGCKHYIPTANVEEVKRGEWKLMGTEKFMDGSYSSKFFCSKCLREIGVCHEHESDNHRYAKSMYPYCHCGAKMDGGKANDL